MLRYLFTGGSHRKREMSERAMSEAGKLDQRLPESAARQPSSRSVRARALYSSYALAA